MAEQMISVVAASSSNYSKKHDVFLSFRGKDTRRNFTSNLYEALMQKKIETYIDYQLEKGDEITLALVKAIENSHISVVIFSENYASSKWCLGELSKIMECKKDKGQIVIPVFYDIDPSHVRKQTGSYEQAFAKHESEPRCNQWKTVLTEVANLAGWDFQTYRTESEFLNDIVDDILRKLAPRYPSQRKGLVGIEENYKQIESLLQIESREVKTIGIWGMGGIGKTTLATALYDKLSCKFEGHCFLANVREKSDKLGDLRDQLFSKLFNDVLRVHRKKVFIVLDDVDTSEQLEKLIEEYDFLGPGSRVIVTTRNKQIFHPVNEIYHVKDLSPDLSLQLFCMAVFGEIQPIDGFEDLSRRVISYCKGIPLALKVLGASLRSKGKDIWECKLSKLQKIPNMEIHKVLQLSYDGLDRSQRDIFLDIACFFKGKSRGYVTRVLDAFGFFPTSEIEVLIDKALLMSGGYWIQMHDLIQEMGREIVHQESIKDPEKRSRLWRYEEVLDVLKYNRGTNVIEGIILDMDKVNEDLYLSSDSLVRMTKLRFLQIKESYQFKVYFPNGLKSLPHKLRCLRWSGFSLESFPTNFCAEQLVMLSMTSSKLKKLWDGVQNLVNLKEIDLEDSEDLIEIPDLSKAEKLEKVNLCLCSSLCQLHSSISSLPKLTKLILSCCFKLQSVNVHSKSLCVLKLNSCVCLEKVSVMSQETTEQILSSEEIDLRGNVGSLSSNMKNLSMLRELWLNNCVNLISLSMLPPSLERLSAYNCVNLDAQKLVLPHMIQRHIPYLHQQYLNDPYFEDNDYFFFWGDCVIGMCGFPRGERSITIPYLPKSDLFGFIYYITISYKPPRQDDDDDDGNEDDDDDYWENHGQNDTILINIYEDGIQVCQKEIDLVCGSSKPSYHHTLLSYLDVSQFERTCEAYDHFSNITFTFELDYNEPDQDRIQWYAVYPVYATTSGLKLVTNSRNKYFQEEYITQISDIESQSRGIGVGDSNNQNEDDQEQLLPALKRTKLYQKP